MALQIGTDEAGYGPNLGPLTVTGTIWGLPDKDCDLFELLEPAVARSAKDSDRLVIADSKAVYSSTGTIETLETTVLAAIRFVFGEMPRNWRELASLLCAGGGAPVPEDEFWLAGRKLELPVSADPARVDRLGDRLAECLVKNGASLDGLLCRAVFPANFNDGLASYGNKASLLSSVTLGIVAELMQQHRTPETGHLSICCDKHGGRSKYAALIQEYLTPSLVMIDQESQEGSRYRWSEEGTECRAGFFARGESSLPVALASMVSKYVREVFMILWNDFWQIEVPGIKPTKGYPVDAKRFKMEIETVQQSLGIKDRDIWRVK